MSLIVILQGSMNINKSHSHPRLAGVFTKSLNRREEVIVVALNRSQVQHVHCNAKNHANT